MDRRSGTGRLTSYLWLVSIVCIIVIFFGVLYYLETEKKEHYFDQLYFRQVEEISRGFETNLARLSSFTRATQNFISEKWGKDAATLEEIAKGRMDEPANTGKSKSAIKNATLEPLPDLLAQEFSRSKNKLNDYSDVSEKNDLVELFVDYTTDEFGESLVASKPEFRKLLSCSEKKKTSHAKYDVFNTYCKVLEDSIEILEKLPDYAKLNRRDVSNDTVESVNKLIGDLLEIKKSEKEGKGEDAILIGNKEVGYLLKIFSSEISSAIDVLISDLKKFLNVVIKVHGYGEINQKERREKYLDDPENVEAAARRHGLGLNYKQVDCTLKGNICGKTGLFIDSLGKTNPYPVSNLIASSYVSDGWVVTAPMENLLPKEMGQFSAVLIASQAGDVIIQTNSLTSPGNQHFLGINDLLVQAAMSLGENGDICKDDDKKAECEKLGDDSKLKHSAYVDETIGGIAYRLYIRPHTVGQVSMRFKGEPQSTLYFVGIKPLSELSASKFKISPNVSMALFLIVVAILLALVFLKIRLANVDASFTRNEGLISVLVIIVFFTVSTIGIATLGMMEKLNHDIAQDANETINQIQDQFKNEVYSYLKYVDYLLSNDQVINELVRKKDGVTNSSVTAQQEQENIPQKQLIRYGNDKSKSLKQLVDDIPYLSENQPAVIGMPEGTSVSPIENLFMLNDKGRIISRLIRGTKNLISSPPKDLSSRTYFRRALANDVWEIHMDCPEGSPLTVCVKNQGREAIYPVYIERIFNILDGARNTQFAMPTLHQTHRASSRTRTVAPFDAEELCG